jgi:hypothetical protein
MATKLVVVAFGLVLVLAALPAPAQEPLITNSSEVTLVGCVEREIDYRARIGRGINGVNEGDVVLSGARAAAGSAVAPGLSGDYSLTGRLEAQLLPDVGRRVQIGGFVEDMATHTSETLNTTTLRRLFIKVWQPAGACS